MMVRIGLQITGWLLLLLLAFGDAKAQQFNLYCQTGPAGLTAWQPASATNPCPVNATASISGFPGTQTTGTPISVTTGGVTGTLPTGTEVVATNTGTTNAAYCKLGASATTSDQYIAPNGGWFGFTVGAATQLTCITSTSTTTVNMVGGSGIPTGTGGGSGGSGGGAVTVADGADVTQGAKADAACGTATGTCTIVAMLKYLASVGLPVTNTNTNGQATPGNSSPVVQAGLAYETIAASQTGQALGATGGTGDFLSHCVIYPTSTSPGVVTVFDSTSSATNNVITFPGGSSSVSNLVPISIPVGAFSINGAWKVTTGANLVAICYGRFT